MTSDMSSDPRAAQARELAAALHEAGARLSGARLPEAEQGRLRRQFIAICDSAKSPDVSPQAVRRRIDGFIVTLEIAIAQYSRHGE